MMTGYAQGYVTFCIYIYIYIYIYILLLGMSNIMYMIICLNPNVLLTKQKFLAWEDGGVG